MKREIKFRAWDKEFKEYSSYHLNRALLVDVNKYDRFLFEQYTGLRDKNGKDIYEGDIYEVYGFKFYVFFQNGSFCGGRIIGDGEPLGWDVEENQYGDIGSGLEQIKNFFESMEIIGNIHENPELL